MAFAKARMLFVCGLAVTVAATVVGQPSRAYAGNNGGAIAAGLIGGAVLGIIATEAARAHQRNEQEAARARRAQRPKAAPTAVKQQPKQEVQAQTVRQAPPAMTSDPFKGVAPAAVPASSVAPASF